MLIILISPERVIKAFWITTLDHEEREMKHDGRLAVCKGATIQYPGGGGRDIFEINN